MKKNLFLAFFTLLTFGNLFAQEFEWVRQIKSNTWSESKAVLADNNGNQYITGISLGKTDFNLGEDSLFLEESKGVYLLKVNTEGETVWVKFFKGGTNTYSLAQDYENNLYLSGSFSGIVDFDPGPNEHSLSTPGRTDMFILKLSSEGEFIWINQFEQKPKGHINNNAITIDQSGNALITGMFEGEIEIETLTGKTTLNSNGRRDVLISKLNSDGKYIWAKSIGGQGMELVNSISTDNNKNVYITGSFSESVDFDPGPYQALQTANGGRDAFILKLDSNGDFAWVKQIGGNSTDNGHLIKAAPSGIYVSGTFNGILDINTTSGNNQISSYGADDIYLGKLDSDGDYLWIKQISGNLSEISTSLDIDNEENIYVLGDFIGLIDLDPGKNTDFHTSEDNFGMFVSKLDINGDYLWGESFGEGTNNASTDLSVSNKSVFITGDLYDSIYFESPDTILYNSGSSFNGFLIKMQDCTNNSVDVQSSCDNYTWIDGNTYTNSNNSARHILSNKAGCDSILTLDLTILNSSQTTDSLASCGPYTWIDGNIYTSSTDTATYIYTNSVGCDSIVSLDLTIISDTVREVISGCDSAQWIDGKTYYSGKDSTLSYKNALGCDSIVNVFLSISNSVIDIGVMNSCGPYDFLGTVYTESGNYTQQLPFPLGACDIVHSSFTLNIIPNTIITDNGGALTSHASDTSTVQWVKCNNDSYSIIENEDAKSFTPAENGDYAAIVDNDGCVDTSACKPFVVSGIENNAIIASEISVYPNPTKGDIDISLGKRYGLISVKIIDVTGQPILQREFYNTDKLKLNLDAESGIYVLEITTENGDKLIRKILKE